MLLSISYASVTRETKEVGVVESTPSAAAVALSTGQTGTTPAGFKVARRDPLTVTVSKPGYRPQTTTIQSQIGTGGGVGIAGNVLLGGLLGAGIDAASGAMYEHKPNPLHITLEKAR